MLRGKRSCEAIFFGDQKLFDSDSIHERLAVCDNTSIYIRLLILHPHLPFCRLFGAIVDSNNVLMFFPIVKGTMGSSCEEEEVLKGYVDLRSVVKVDGRVKSVTLLTIILLQ